MTAQELVRTSVDLRSYSSSPGWVGFFERRADFSPDLCDKAVDLLMACPFVPTWEMEVLSGLAIHGTDDVLRADFGEEFGARELYEYVNPLHAYGLLRRIVSENDGWSDCDVYFAGLLSEGGEVKVDSDEHLGLARLVFASVMCVCGVRGHCFGVTADRQLIVYPHEDTGFGFICRAGQQESLKRLQQQIQNHFASDEFRVVLA